MESVDPRHAFIAWYGALVGAADRWPRIDPFSPGIARFSTQEFIDYLEALARIGAIIGTYERGFAMCLLQGPSLDRADQLARLVRLEGVIQRNEQRDDPTTRRPIWQRLVPAEIHARAADVFDDGVILPDDEPAVTAYSLQAVTAGLLWGVTRSDRLDEELRLDSGPRRPFHGRAGPAREAAEIMHYFTERHGAPPRPSPGFLQAWSSFTSDDDR